MTKQVIVIRRDLNMRKGKMCAQAAHASMKVFFDNMELLEAEREREPFSLPDPKAPIKNLFFSTFKKNFNDAMLSWLGYKEGEHGFTKIVVGCEAESDIFEIEKRCIEAGIPCAKIIDNGVTEFGGIKTLTCIAVGPDESEKIDPITGVYPLL